MTVFTYKSSEIADLRDEEYDSKTTGKKIFDVIKNSLIAFFSFTVHRLFMNLPSLPRQIKI